MANSGVHNRIKKGGRKGGMRKPEKRNFVIVAELHSRRVQAIIEGPDEKTVSNRLDAVDTALLKKANELATRFPATAYDVVITRAQGLDDLRDAFPEFSGWEQVRSEPLALA
jgi:hypothetical protein